jgi:hypothetical protein
MDSKRIPWHMVDLLVGFFGQNNGVFSRRAQDKGIPRIHRCETPRAGNAVCDHLHGFLTVQKKRGQAPQPVPFLECPRQESNLHEIAPTRPSTAIET